MNLRDHPALNVFLLGMGAAVALGVARFAYALVLPDMQRELGWTYAEAGWLGTSNAAGHTAGALLTAAIAARWGLRQTLLFGCWTTALAVLATAFTDDYAALNALRFIAGVTGAFTFIVGGVMAAAIVSTLPDSRQRGKVLGLFYGAPGLGVMMSAVVVPVTTASGDWRLAWMVLGAVACALALLMTIASRDAENRPSASGEGVLYETASLIPLWLAYAAFGAGYIGYMTFMFAHLRDLGASAGQLTLFWCMLGLGVVVSPWVWARVLDRQRHGRAISMPAGVLVVGAGLPLVNSSWAIALLSAAIFGAALFTVPAATTAFVRRNYGSSDWPRAIGILTVGFGLGQIGGPVLAGYVSDLSGRLNDGLWWGCAFLALAGLFALAQRDVVR